MLRNVLVIGGFLGVAASLTAADIAASAPRLSAKEIVDKNVAARGGLEAWRSVKTMSLTGKLDAGGNQRATLQVPSPAPTQFSGRRSVPPVIPSRPVEEVQLPFLMELERPRKMRFELEFNGQTAVQVYDGANGWKLRPFLGRRVVEPYTADELKTSSMQADLDGPLMDYPAKGTRVELVGSEPVDGRDTYKIKMTMKDGQVLHVWIDALTFLEAKIEGQPRRLDGTLHPVEIYFRDYRPVEGLRIPFVLDTKVLPVATNALGLRDTPAPPERIVMEKVVINPKFEESLFSKPDEGLSASIAK
jgi:hypothetical protein